MRLKVLRAFSWAHRNVEVVPYATDQVIDTEDEDLIRVACDEGWAQSDEQADEEVRAGDPQGDQVEDQQAANEQSGGEQKTPRAKRVTK